MITIVSVQVNAHAKQVASSVFSPKTVISVGVFITVGVHHREEVPINVLNILALFIPIFRKRVNDERDYGRRNPLTTLNVNEKI